MIFNTPVFLFLFLPVALALFFFVPRKYKTVFLVLASIAFYTWGEGELIILLLLSVFFNYIAGLLLERYNNQAAGRFILIAAVLLNIGGLVFYKYTGFLAENLNIILSALDIPAITINPIYFPLGISFFTFQALSYLYDVYREVAPAEHNPVKAALYMTFFPKLISGPIIRYSDMKEQMDAGIQVSTTDVYEGLKRFITGLAKKVIIADNLALYANQVFSETTNELSAVSVWAGIVVYGLQMYYDFSGYTDIARGSARIMGYDLMVNFRLPYFSKNVKEFWQRWHISLSTWFRDYLYISMGGNRKGKNRQTFNTFVVFVVSGLWHGANWTFVIWGALHGLYVTAGSMMSGIRKKVNSFLGWKENMPIRKIYDIGLTFLLVNFAWIFFRANNTGDAFTLIAHIFKNSSHWFSTSFIQTWDSFTISLVMLALLLFIQLLIRKSDFPDWAGKQPAILRYSLYMILLWSVLLFGNFGNHQFIYFQF